jgi:ABC-type transport system involved in multi-copper enzyme maturation permease subunit
MATSANRADDARTAGQTLALVIGAAYVLVGILGFFVTGLENFASPTNERLLGIFEINPLHNVVHLIIGFAGLALWKRRDTARAYGVALAVGYGLTFLFGLFVANKDTSANFLSINGADNGLHLISALAGVAIVMLLSRTTTTMSSSTARARSGERV